MGKLSEDKNYEKAEKLRSLASDWFERTFNTVRLELYEAALEKDGSHLIEVIRQPDIEEKLDFYIERLNKAELKELKKEISKTDNISIKDVTLDVIREYLVKEKENEVIDLYEQNHNLDDNYPMWSTLFEFKYDPSNGVLDAAQKVGLGVIESNDYWNPTLFAASAGHSFYSAYWIPLYLALHEDVAKKFKNVKFGMV